MICIFACKKPKEPETLLLLDPIVTTKLNEKRALFIDCDVLLR